MAADALQTLKSALADRYTIERELGRGGMAVVYLARDPKHNRRVALKVLLPELALSVRAERFLREIQIAAQLTHPHILGLHDSGEAEGFLYYVMPYVAGESLRDRLRREPQLPVADALQIAREVAAALAYAHTQGVLHRDIKPENILLSPDGHAVVADFGIARALTEAGGQTVTQTGIAVGTPVYMSPEQGAGSKALDGRSDIYSLGCVVYEMLAGQPPFTGESAQEILAHHALDPVPRLRKLRPEVPPDVEDVILHALAKRPADRLGTAAAFAAALAAPGTARPGALRRRLRRTSRLGLYASLGLGVLVVGYVVAARTDLLHPARPAASAQSVAVLPFVNLSADTANEYFTEGMTDELIGALSRVEGLRVPARTSSFAFKGKTADIRDIGRQLSVAHVLEGSVQRAGSRLRVTAQLIKVTDGYHLWSETYDRELKDVFAVQDELTRAIVQALQVKLAPAPASAPPRPENLEAYQLYLKGRLFWNKGTEDGLNRALEFFSAAIAQDSGYARAYAGLADVYERLLTQAYLPRAEGYPKARAAALRAVALDSQLAEAYTSRGMIRFLHEWDWSGGEQDFRRAIALNPGYAIGHVRYGTFLAQQSRFPEAIREARRATELDPLSVEVLLTYEFVLFFARQYVQAAEQARKALELEPTPAGHQRLAEAYLFQDRFADAIREFKVALGLVGGRGRVSSRLTAPSSMMRLGYAYARAGRRDEALQILDQVKALGPSNIGLAQLYAVLGEKDQAYASLERAYQRHDFGLANLRVSPFFDPLRSDPRFTQMLKKVGLEP